MLNWVAHEHDAWTLCAVGARGEYSIKRVGMEWVLSAVGHDGLPMLTLPHYGYVFCSLDQVQERAEELDQAPAEAEVSGS